jgi:hypothetical protein
MNDTAWKLRDATICARELIASGYHPLLLLPHDMPLERFEHSKGKAPASFSARNGWELQQDWQKAKTFNVDRTFRTLQQNTRRTPNLGVLCGLPVKSQSGEGYLTAIDVDTADETTIKLLSELFGNANPIRRGKRGGTFICITDDNVSKDFTRPAGSEHFIADGDDNKVQFMRDGRQTVMAGIHPKTLKPFQWQTVGTAEPAQIPAVAGLPVVTTGELEALLASRGFQRGSSSKQLTAEGKTTFEKRWRALKAELAASGEMDYADVDEELDIENLLKNDEALAARLLVDHDQIDNHNGNDQSIGNRLKGFYGGRFTVHHLKSVLSHFDACAASEKQDDRYVARIMANAEQKAAGWQAPPHERSNGVAFGNVENAERLSELEADMAAITRRLDVARSDAALDEPGADDRVYELEAELERAQQAVVKIETNEAAYTVTGETADTKTADTKTADTKTADTAPMTKSERIRKATPWVNNVARVPPDLDISTLPPRPFLYGRELLRGSVALLAAPGGAGKSLLQLSVAIDLACGVDHLGVEIKRARRVFLYDAEDSLDELYRRVGAYMKAHEFTDAMKVRVHENLLLLSGATGAVKIAHLDGNKVVIDSNQIEALEYVIKGHAAEVVIMNPLRSLHETAENSNDAMSIIFRELTRVAATLNVAAWLAHHTKKGIGDGIDNATQDDASGAGAITTTARVMSSLRELTEKDAKELGVPTSERYNVFAWIGGLKPNYSARGSSNVRLLSRETIRAANGNNEHVDDETGALRKYERPATNPFGVVADGDADVTEHRILLGAAACDTLEEFIESHMRRESAGSEKPMAFIAAELRDTIGNALDHFAPKGRSKVRDPVRLANQRGNQFDRAISRMEKRGGITVERANGRSSILRLTM